MEHRMWTSGHNPAIRNVDSVQSDFFCTVGSIICTRNIGSMHYLCTGCDRERNSALRRLICLRNLLAPFLRFPFLNVDFFLCSSKPLLLRFQSNLPGLDSSLFSNSRPMFYLDTICKFLERLFFPRIQAHVLITLIPVTSTETNPPIAVTIPQRRCNIVVAESDDCLTSKGYALRFPF